jgi:hypothetical protein
MLGFIFIIALAINGLLSHFVAETARTKQLGYGTAFFVSFFFSPIIGVLLSIASPQINTVDNVDTVEVIEEEVVDYSVEEVPTDKTAQNMESFFIYGFVAIAAIALIAMFV